jgi:hypothetical protein
MAVNAGAMLEIYLAEVRREELPLTEWLYVESAVKVQNSRESPQCLTMPCRDVAD